MDDRLRDLQRMVVQSPDDYQLWVRFTHELARSGLVIWVIEDPEKHSTYESALSVLGDYDALSFPIWMPQRLARQIGRELEELYDRTDPGPQNSWIYDYWMEANSVEKRVCLDYDASFTFSCAQLTRLDVFIRSQKELMDKLCDLDPSFMPPTPHRFYGTFQVRIREPFLGPGGNHSRKFHDRMSLDLAMRELMTIYRKRFDGLLIEHVVDLNRYCRVLVVNDRSGTQEKAYLQLTDRVAAVSIDDWDIDPRTGIVTIRGPHSYQPSNPPIYRISVMTHEAYVDRNVGQVPDGEFVERITARELDGRTAYCFDTKELLDRWAVDHD